jgi:hypothetical protein
MDRAETYCEGVGEKLCSVLAIDCSAINGLALESRRFPAIHHSSGYSARPESLHRSR